MKSLNTALLLGVLSLSSASALSGRGAFVISSVNNFAGLKTVAWPGKMGTAHTSCASSAAGKANLQAKLSAYKGWKQTDPWKAGSAGFTSTGTDQFIVTVMNKIGGKGQLVIISEF